MKKQDRQKAPLPCPEMAEVRNEIDRIDRELVTLLRERLNWVEQAGKVKRNRDQVVDTPRIEEVIVNVVARANDQGLPAEMTEKLWRLLIDQSIAHEYRIFDGKTPDKN
ncbi:MAG: chorismate mutase [Parvibaculales bacterium]